MLKRWLDHTAMPVAELARRSGIDRGSLYRFMAGSGAARKSVRRLAEAFGVSDAEYLAGPPTGVDEPQAEHVVELPYFEAVPAGGWDSADVDRDATYPVLHHQAKAGRVVVKVAGQSMYPTIWSDDLVLVDTTRHAPRSGDIVVAKSNGGWTLKRFRRVRRQVILTADNPLIAPLEIEGTLEVLGTVVGIVWRDVTKALV